MWSSASAGCLYAFLTLFVVWTIVCWVSCRNAISRQRKRIELLAELATIINKFGPDSEEINYFISCHLDDGAFFNLSEFFRTLKRDSIKNKNQ